MDKLTFSTGWKWITQGWDIYRKRPFFLMIVLMGYGIVIGLLDLVPSIGRFLIILLTPVFTFLFIYTCYRIDTDQTVWFKEIFNGFNGRTFFRLLMLGACYILFYLVVLAFVVAMDVNLASVFRTGEGIEKLSDSQQNLIYWSLGFFMIVYVPFVMATWFATPLIGFKDMSVGKALFYSFFGAARAFRSLLSYLFCWFMIGLFLVVMTGFFVTLFTTAGAIVVWIGSFIVSVWFYCSFYPAYKRVFGQPDGQP